MSAELVRELNERAGCGLKIIEVIDRGQSGAAVVRWPDGRESVVTTAFATLDLMRQTAEVLGEARTLGIPVPRHEFLFEVSPGTVAVVQERLPGVTHTVADLETVKAIVAVNERFAGLLEHRLEVPTVALRLARPADAEQVDLVRPHGERARRMIDWIHGTIPPDGPDMIGNDLVHVDLTVSNMLFGEDGAITGVIDWNYGVARGDRRFGLIKLRHNLAFAAHTGDAEAKPTTEAEEFLDQLLAERLTGPELRRYWAHQTLNMLHVSLRWGTEEAFMHYLQLGEARLNPTNYR